MSVDKPWIVSSLRLVGEFFGVRPDTIKQGWLPAGMPREKVSARKYAYDLKGIFEWWKQREQEAAEASQDRPSTEVADKYRDVKTEREQVLLDKLRGTLVSRSDMHAFILYAARFTRQAGEQLERKFGPDARGILDEQLDELDNRIADFFDDRSDHTNA